MPTTPFRPDFFNETKPAGPLLDSRGDPIKDKDAKDTAMTGSREGQRPNEGRPPAREPKSEGIMDFREVERKEITPVAQEGAAKDLKKATAAASEGAKDVAQTAGAVAGHTKEGAKDIANDAVAAAKEVSKVAQSAAGHARASGKEVIEDIREGAKGLADTAREVASESKEAIQETAAEVSEVVRDAKDRAVHSVSEAAHKVGPSLRRANRATGTFVAANAVPISLLGFGAGWLMMTSRRRQSARQETPRALLNTSALPSQPEPKALPSSLEVKSIHGQNGKAESEVTKLAKETSHRLRDTATEAREGVQHVASDARDRIVDLTHRAVHQAQDARDAVSERASKLKKEAGVQLDRAKDATVHVAQTNPLLLIALSLGAGVGGAMLFPSSKPEKRLMGATRDRLVDEAGDTAARVGDVARKTARDLRTNISP